jgi:hypothetical protein
MKVTHSALLLSLTLIPSMIGCGANSNVDVVDLNRVVDALVAVLDEGSAVNRTNSEDTLDEPTEIKAEATTMAEIYVVTPEKEDPAKESQFLTKFAAKLNEFKVMRGPVNVSMTAGGEIIGFQDPNQNAIQDIGEEKEFTVTMDVANNRLVASDNNGYHRPHSYGFRPSGMMMGYMLGSMMGRQNSYYSGAMASSKPGFSNVPMSPAKYHSNAVSSVRSRVSSSASSAARIRTGSKGFSFGK